MEQLSLKYGDCTPERPCATCRVHSSKPCSACRAHALGIDWLSLEAHRAMFEVHLSDPESVDEDVVDNFYHLHPWEVTRSLAAAIAAATASPQLCRMTHSSLRDVLEAIAPNVPQQLTARDIVRCLALLAERGDDEFNRLPPGSSGPSVLLARRLVESLLGIATDRWRDSAVLERVWTEATLLFGASFSLTLGAAQSLGARLVKAPAVCRLLSSAEQAN